MTSRERGGIVMLIQVESYTILNLAGMSLLTMLDEAR